MSTLSIPDQMRELAKAIREGSKDKHQCYHTFFIGDDQVCALGAVALLVDPGLCHAPELVVTSGLCHRFPFLQEDVDSDHLYYTWRDRIIEWNDNKKLSFKQIAALLVRYARALELQEKVLE